MADLPARSVGVAGHVADHNAIHSWLNAQGYDEGHDLLADHIGFPGGTANFLRADGTFASPGGAAGSPGFNTAMGHQYVRASGGSDSNDGASPSTAKATIQAAHNALPTNGGTIWLSEGTHLITSQIEISKRGVALIGTGRTASRLKCGTANIHMVHWTGADGFCSNFVVTDGSDGSFGQPLVARGLSGIWLDNAQEMVMLSVRFDNFGMGAATGLSFDAGPAALRIETQTGFGDWMGFFQLIFRSCYRSISGTSGNNGRFVDCAMYGSGEERVYIEKRTATGGAGATFHFLGCHFAGSGSANRWSVRLEHGTGSTAPHRLGTTFTGCIFELSAATTGIGGAYVNGTEVSFDHTMCTTGAKPTVRTGPDAGECKFGHWIGPTPRLESPVGNNNLRSWVPTDHSGTVASGAINTY